MIQSPEFIFTPDPRANGDTKSAIRQETASIRLNLAKILSKKDN